MRKDFISQEVEKVFTEFQLHQKSTQKIIWLIGALRNLVKG